MATIWTWSRKAWERASSQSVMAAAGVGPFVLIDADDLDALEAGRAGGEQQLASGLDGDGVDGVPTTAELAGDRGHGGLVQHQPAQNERRAAPGGRRAGSGEPAGVVGEH